MTAARRPMKNRVRGVSKCPLARRLIVRLEVDQQFIDGGLLHLREDRRTHGHAALSILQEPFRLLLLFRVCAFPNRLSAAIVFDPEHLASFVDHSHGLTPPIGVAVMKRWGFLTAYSVLKRCQRGRLL